MNKSAYLDPRAITFSSNNSFPVTLILSLENSDNCNPSTIFHSPFLQVTGKEKLTSDGAPYSPLEITPMLIQVP